MRQRKPRQEPSADQWNQQPSTWFPLWISALTHMNEQPDPGVICYIHTFTTAPECWWQTPAQNANNIWCKGIMGLPNEHRDSVSTNLQSVQVEYGRRKWRTSVNATQTICALRMPSAAALKRNNAFKRFISVNKTFFLMRVRLHTLRRGGGQKEFWIASVSSVRKSKRARRDAHGSASGLDPRDGTVARSHPGRSGVFLHHQHLEEIRWRY